MPQAETEDLEERLENVASQYDGGIFFAWEAVHAALGLVVYLLSQAEATTFQEVVDDYAVAIAACDGAMERHVLTGTASYIAALGGLVIRPAISPIPGGVWDRLVDPIPGKVFPMTHLLPLASKVAVVEAMIERSDRAMASAIEQSVAVLLGHLIKKGVLDQGQVADELSGCYDPETLEEDYAGCVLHGIHQRLGEATRV